MALKAPKFANRILGLIQDSKMSQRKIADEANVSASKVNRLCRHGTGSEEDICKILIYLKIKRRRILEMLTDRRAELSTGEANAMWSNFRFAFLDENEYLEESSPLPANFAYACSKHGISINRLCNLLKEHDLSNIKDMGKLSDLKLATIGMTASKVFSKEIINKVMNSYGNKDCIPALLLDSFTVDNPDKYIDLINCEGQLVYGIPHIALGNYRFNKKGAKILEHAHLQGVEILYSIDGTYELKLDGSIYPFHLSPNGSIFEFHACKSHEITLIDGDKGRLLMVRYYPKKRDVKPPREEKKPLPEGTLRRV